MKTLYLNIQTEQRTHEFISNDITIDVNDARVKAFFTPYDKVKYDLILDVDTFKLKEYVLKEDGTRYDKYNQDGTPLLPTQEELDEVAYQIWRVLDLASEAEVLEAQRRARYESGL